MLHWLYCVHCSFLKFFPFVSTRGFTQVFPLTVHSGFLLQLAHTSNYDPHAVTVLDGSPLYGLAGRNRDQLGSNFRAYIFPVLQPNSIIVICEGRHWNGWKAFWAAAHRKWSRKGKVFIGPNDLRRPAGTCTCPHPLPLLHKRSTKPSSFNCTT